MFSMDSLKRKRYSICTSIYKIVRNPKLSSLLYKFDEKQFLKEIKWKNVITTKQFILIAKIYVLIRKYQREAFNEDLSY